MRTNFDVLELDVDNLLKQWRWLCPDVVTLVARSGFGDLFLLNTNGTVLWLDITNGSLSVAAESESEFLEYLDQSKFRERWLAESDLQASVERELALDDQHCIGFKTPLVFKESVAVANNAYVANLYEYVSFLGSLHRQIAKLKDGEKVRLTIDKPV